MKNSYVSIETVNRTLDLAVKNKKDYSIDYDNKKISFHEDGNKIWELKLPLLCGNMEQGVNAVPPFHKKYLIILVRSGAASSGYFEDEELVYHKVIKSYMVRKKQGKSQLTYLKTKGKSRLGSRIRLKNSLRFFEDIGNKIDEWNILDCVEKIFIYCPVSLLSFLYNPAFPVDKDDNRIQKVPFDVKTPDFNELLKIEKLFKKGILLSEKKVAERFFMDSI